MYDPEMEEQVRVMETLTSIMEDEKLEAKDRLRAAELAGCILEMFPEDDP